MTKDEMLKELDTLKELTNENGKRIVDGLKGSLSALVLAGEVDPVVPVEKVVEVEKVVIDAGRRSDVRDPGESDQHKAEALKLA